MTDQAQLLPGTLDLLILRAVSLGPLHGYGILLRIGQISGNALLIEQGALYPGLFRLVRQGLLKASWGTSENNRRAKFYELTAAGRKRLREETDNWNRLVDGHWFRARCATGGSMKLLDSLRFRIATLLPAFRRSNAEMEEELRSHIQHRADDLERSGLDRAEAERRARIEFGGQVTIQRRMPRSAGRQFRRDRCCRMCASPSRVAQVSRIHGRRGCDAGTGHRRKRRGFWRIECADPAPAECAAGGEPLRNRAWRAIKSALQSYPDYLDLRDRNRSFDGSGSLSTSLLAGLDTGNDPSARRGCYEVSGKLLRRIGHSAVSRPFLPRLRRAWRRTALRISCSAYAYWHSHFQDDRGVVGRVVQVNKHPFTIVGVAPPEFHGTFVFFSPDFFVPIVNQEQVDGQVS